jgi:vacuolar protein sorting-associated protein 72
MNLRNLERVLAREEEVKKKAVINKAKYDGPEIRFFSRDGTLFSCFSIYIYIYIELGYGALQSTRALCALRSIINFKSE